jgi:hypothetical protein
LPRARRGPVHAQKPGRPPFVPTQQQRNLGEYLTSIAIPQEEIAREWIIPPVALRTLQTHFRAELDRGAEALPALRRETERMLRRFARRCLPRG